MSKKATWASALACAVGLLSPFSALATPVEDLQVGGSIFVSEVRGTLRGEPKTEGGFFIEKTPGTLMFHIDRASFGLGAGEPLDITATPIDGNTVELVIDKELSPSFTSGDAEIKHVSGTARARVVPVAGGVAPFCGEGGCGYSVRLEFEPGATVRVTGTYHTPFFMPDRSIDETISAISAWGFGGISRPPLSSFTITAPEVMCPSVIATRTFFGHVHLALPAPSLGAWVDLDSSDPSILPVRRLWVKGGQQDAYFPIRFGSSERGSYIVRASSGGATQAQAFKVDACISLLGFIDRYAPRVDLLAPFCETCIDDARLTDRGPIVVHEPGGWVRVEKNGDLVPVDALVGGHVYDLKVNDFGEMAGSFEQYGEYYSFHTLGRAGDGQTITLPPGSVSVLSPNGITLGQLWGQNQQAEIVAHNADGLFGVGGPANVGWMTGTLSSGWPVFVSYEQGAQLWKATAEGFEPLQVPGNYPYVVSTNQSGQMLVVSYDEQWSMNTWVVDSFGQARPVELPEWAQYMWPVGLTDEGAVFANVYNDNWEAMPVVFREDNQAIPLMQMVEGLNWPIREVVSVTPGGRLVVRVEQQGQWTVKILDPIVNQAQGEEEYLP